MTSGSESGFGAFGSQSSGFGASGSQSVFGQTLQPTQGTLGQTTTQSSLFGKPQSDQTNGQSQNLFGQSLFGQGPTFGQQTGTQSGLFGQQTGTQSGLFGQTSRSQPTGLFGKTDSVSAGASPQGPPATPQSLFGASGPSVIPNTPAQTGSGLFSGSTNSKSQTTGSPFGGSSNFGSSTAAVVPSGSSLGHTAGHQSAQTGSLYTPLDKLTSEELEQYQAATFTLGKIPTKPPPRELCF